MKKSRLLVLGSVLFATGCGFAKPLTFDEVYEITSNMINVVTKDDYQYPTEFGYEILYTTIEATKDGENKETRITHNLDFSLSKNYFHFSEEQENKFEHYYLYIHEGNLYEITIDKLEQKDIKKYTYDSLEYTKSEFENTLKEKGYDEMIEEASEFTDGMEFLPMLKALATPNSFPSIDWIEEMVPNGHYKDLQIVNPRSEGPDHIFLNFGLTAYNNVLSYKYYVQEFLMLGYQFVKALTSVTKTTYDDKGVISLSVTNMRDINYRYSPKITFAH